MKDKAKVKEVAKFAVKASLMIFAGVAASATVAAVIKNIVPMGELTKINKVLIPVGAFALGGAAANAGANYVGQVFDDSMSYTEAYIKLMQTLFSDPPKEEPVEIV